MRSYTPLRYPGGKVRLFEFTKELINNNLKSKPVYVEAFAGGAGLALKLLTKEIVSEVYINDYDFAIYCFWNSLKNSNNDFIAMLENSTFSIDEWKRQKKIYLEAYEGKHSELDIGFATFYLNRTNRSGIMVAGPIGGYKQDGNYKMDCRFNKPELIKIILNVGRLSNRIHVYNCDANKFILNLDDLLEDALFYLDPPYVKRGPELYKSSFDDQKHQELKNVVESISNYWFMTYDEDPLIRNLYKDFPIQTYELRYNAQIKRKAIELAVFSKSLDALTQIEI